MSGSKINVAKQAIEYIKNNLHPEMILGIGTGSTVNFFIEELKEYRLSLIHISEPTRQAEISYAVFCLKKKKKIIQKP